MGSGGDVGSTRGEGIAVGREGALVVGSIVGAVVESLEAGAVMADAELTDTFLGVGSSNAPTTMSTRLASRRKPASRRVAITRVHVTRCRTSPTAAITSATSPANIKKPPKVLTP